jgi:hypothetical protein
MDQLLYWIHTYKDIFDVLGAVATASAVIISLSLTFGNRPKISYLSISKQMHAPLGGANWSEHLHVSAINTGRRAARCFDFYIRTGRLWYKKRLRIASKESPYLNGKYESLSLLLDQDSVITTYIDLNDFLRVHELSPAQLKAMWIGLSTSNGRYEARIPDEILKYWSEASKRDPAHSV